MTRQPPERPAPSVDDDGVDVTLIRWMLSLTPRQRLQALQTHVRSLERLKRGRDRD